MCSADTVMKAVEIFGLDSASWTVVATISQALAAFGALSLLYVTWRSGKDTKAAIEYSRALAKATEQLVVASKTQRELAILPVAEVAYEQYENRFRIINKGNGPLLKPTVTLDGELVEILGYFGSCQEYAQIATLSCNGESIVNLDGTPSQTSVLRITGITLSGGEFDVSINFKDFGKASRLVAVASQQSKGDL